MIRITTQGDARKTARQLEKLRKNRLMSDFDNYGKRGVAALEAATPVETGMTAQSWAYRIRNDRLGPRVEWYNTHKVDETVVAVLIQYGHATGTGGYVMGIDYINPAMRPIFDEVTQEIWKKVTAS